MIFNNTKVIQARLHFRKETGALIEVFCLEPVQPNDYVLNFQQTRQCSWLCMIGNLKKWKEGTLSRIVNVKGKQIVLSATQAIAVGTTSVRTLESLYYIGVLISHNPDATQDELHVQQWMPYEDKNDLTPVEALQQILDYLNRHEMEALHSSTQIIIAPGYTYKIVKKMVTNFHQPQSTLLLLVSAFVKGNWRRIYDYALGHDFRFLSYGDSSLLIP